MPASLDGFKWHQLDGSSRHGPVLALMAFIAIERPIALFEMIWSYVQGPLQPGSEVSWRCPRALGIFWGRRDMQQFRLCCWFGRWWNMWRWQPPPCGCVEHTHISSLGWSFIWSHTQDDGVGGVLSFLGTVSGILSVPECGLSLLPLKTHSLVGLGFGWALMSFSIAGHGVKLKNFSCCPVICQGTALSLHLTCLEGRTDRQDRELAVQEAYECYPRTIATFLMRPWDDLVSRFAICSKSQFLTDIYVWIIRNI